MTDLGRPGMPGAQLSPAVAIKGSLLAKNTLLNLLGLGLPLLVGVVTMPFVVRGLGTDRFGLLALIWAIFGYFGILDLGLGRATTKFVAEAWGRGELEEIPKYAWTTVIFQAALGVAGALVLVAVTPLLVEHILTIPPRYFGEARTTFYLIAASLPVNILTPSVRGILEAGQRFDLVNSVRIPASAAFYLLPLVGVWLGLGLPGIVVLILISRVVAFAAWGILSAKAFPVLIRRPAFFREKVRRLFSFGGWVTLSSVVWPVMLSLDRFFIGAMLSVAAVGYYSAPNEVVMRLGVIPGSVGLTLFPTFSALSGRQEQERSAFIFARSVKYLLLIMVPLAVGLIFFARPFLALWLGPEFVQNSTRVLQILAAGYLFSALSTVPSGFLQGVGRADIPTKIQISVLILYVPLMWGLIRLNGIEGAALALSLRSVLQSGMLFLAAHKLGRFGATAYAMDRVDKSVVVLALYAAAVLALRPTAFGLVVFSFFTLGLALGAWFWLFVPEERNWLRAKLRRPPAAEPLAIEK